MRGALYFHVECGNGVHLDLKVMFSSIEKQGAEGKRRLRLIIRASLKKICLTSHEIVTIFFFFFCVLSSGWLTSYVGQSEVPASITTG